MRIDTNNQEQMEKFFNEQPEPPIYNENDLLQYQNSLIDDQKTIRTTIENDIDGNEKCNNQPHIVGDISILAKLPPDRKIITLKKGTPISKKISLKKISKDGDEFTVYENDTFLENDTECHLGFFQASSPNDVFLQASLQKVTNEKHEWFLVHLNNIPK
jgi:hypothetical protein